jgi:hypothetical protein
MAEVQEVSYLEEPSSHEVHVVVMETEITKITQTLPQHETDFEAGVEGLIR